MNGWINEPIRNNHQGVDVKANDPTLHTIMTEDGAIQVAWMGTDGTMHYGQQIAWGSSNWKGLQQFGKAVQDALDGSGNNVSHQNDTGNGSAGNDPAGAIQATGHHSGGDAGSGLPPGTIGSNDGGTHDPGSGSGNMGDPPSPFDTNDYPNPNNTPAGGGGGREGGGHGTDAEDDADPEGKGADGADTQGGHPADLKTGHPTDQSHVVTHQAGAHSINLEHLVAQYFNPSATTEVAQVGEATVDPALAHHGIVVVGVAPVVGHAGGGLL